MRDYVPYFESTYGSIIPFEQISFINEMQETGSGKCTCTIASISGNLMKCFTFKSTEDMINQMDNYKEYLITKYKKKELV